jgi:hypothetical protein
MIPRSARGGRPPACCRPLGRSAAVRAADVVVVVVVVTHFVPAQAAEIDGSTQRFTLRAPQRRLSLSMVRGWRLHAGTLSLVLIMPI